MPTKKRHYAAVATLQQGDSWQVLLDSAVLHTPAKHAIDIPTEALADAIAEEWDCDILSPHAMPLTRLASIAHDIVPAQRELLLEDMMRYGETDLLCYRASEADLAALQAQHFDPVLTWAEATHGLQFETTHDAAPIAQPEASLRALRVLLMRADAFELAALAMATPILGSVLLALALWEAAITPEEAIAAARVDETYQAAKYGEDDETEASWREKARDIVACAKILNKATS